jgi:PAS domain S-box-containing protein
MDKFPLPPVEQKEKKTDPPISNHRLPEVIIQTTDLSIISTDAQGVITSFNRGAEKLLGYSAEDVIGKLTLQLFHDQQEVVERTESLNRDLGLNLSPGFQTFVVRVQDKETPDRQEWTYIHKNGRRFPVILSISSLWENEEIVGYAGIASEISEQKKAHRLQEEAQAQLQALIASVDDIVFELDHHGRFMQVWVKSDEYLFLPREEILGKTLSEIFGKEFSAPFDAGFERVLTTGENFTWEYPSVKPGDSKWFSAKCAMIRKNGKATNRVSVCIQNITDRKLIELSLRKSEEKFRLLAANIPGVIYIMRNDIHNSMMYVNDHIAECTGYTADEFYSGSLHLTQLIHKDDKTYVNNLRAKCIQDQVSYTLEYRIRHKSGKWRWIYESGIGVHSGSDTLLHGFLSDISDRKESEEELRRMADENSRIFNNSITLTALADFDGYFKRLNPAWEKTLGWSRDELLQQSFYSLIHPDDVAKTEEIIRLIASGHTVTMFENRYRCRDGSYRWLLWGSSPDIGRKLIYASAIDITSRKKSEEELLMSKRNLEAAAYELEEQNRQLDEFAHIISHNLRAPVANIKALLNFIDDSSQIGDYQLIFEKIRNVTHNIGETMNELLETIKIRKTHDIERIEIRFKDVLDKIVQSLEGELIESGATVTYNFNNAPKIYYSKPYLESILQNLISNAIKYRSPKRIPEIFVSTDLVRTGIELRVQDNGLGIDLEQFGKKLFGLHKTFHENKEARGVGLFLTKTQIETLGGSIKAESVVNEGTTFIIQF